MHFFTVLGMKVSEGLVSTEAFFPNFPMTVSSASSLGHLGKPAWKEGVVQDHPSSQTAPILGSSAVTTRNREASSCLLHASALIAHSLRERLEYVWRWGLEVGFHPCQCVGKSPFLLGKDSRAASVGETPVLQ